MTYVSIHRGQWSFPVRARETPMEVDITSFCESAEPSEFSASVAERGANAGRETWANAVREGSCSPLLTTPKQIAALRDYVGDFGAWSEEEIAAWSDTECNALFIQLISGDLRELESLCMGEGGEIDWKRAGELSDHGTIGGNIYPGDNGRIYFYLGH